MRLSENSRIGIDVRMAQHSGIGRYIRGFVPALPLEPSKRRYTLIGRDANRSDFPSHMTFTSTRAPIYSIQEQIAFLPLAHSLDCLHMPHYNAPLFWKKKLVITVHDLIHLHFANHFRSPLASFYAHTMLRESARRADAIIAVSEHTKKDLVMTLGIRAEKITVIYHGIDPKFIVTEKKRNPQKDIKPYFLYVGLVKAHKNLGVLIKAFLSLRKKRDIPDLELRIVGTPDHKQAAVRRWLETIRHESSISLVNSVSDEELMTLYQNAAALVFPSLHEGFGFPLLEAMASRTPIIASRAASIPEVAGDKAALYFDPLSADELTHQMEKLLQDTELQNRLTCEGAKRVQLFNWHETGNKIAKIYDTVLGKN